MHYHRFVEIDGDSFNCVIDFNYCCYWRSNDVNDVINVNNFQSALKQREDVIRHVWHATYDFLALISVRKLDGTHRYRYYYSAVRKKISTPLSQKGNLIFSTRNRFSSLVGHLSEEEFIMNNDVRRCWFSCLPGSISYFIMIPAYLWMCRIIYRDVYDTINMTSTFTINVYNTYIYHTNLYESL